MKKPKVFHDVVRGKPITFTLDASERGVLRAPQRVRITSFATFKDLVGYIVCLQGGGSSTFCYRKGDNGKGAWGDTTAQIRVAMCALPPVEMVRRWGSSAKARGKSVRVTFSFNGNERSVICEVRDKGPDGVCDLNPAALKEADLPIDLELSVTGTWEWL